MQRMPEGERHEHWRLEKKGIDTILRQKNIRPGDFLFIPEEEDEWENRFFLYRSPIKNNEEHLLRLDEAEGFPMFVETSTWTHPSHPEWHGIPCIKVLVDVVYMIGKPGLPIRRIAKKIQRLDFL